MRHQLTDVCRKMRPRLGQILPAPLDPLRGRDSPRGPRSSPTSVHDMGILPRRARRWKHPRLTPRATRTTALAYQ